MDLMSLREVIQTARDNYEEDETSGTIWIHRNIPGQHSLHCKPSGQPTCWCEPLSIDSGDRRSTDEILADLLLKQRAN